MAEKKYLDLEGLKIYDGKIKGYVDGKESALDEAIKKVADDLSKEVTRAEGVEAANAASAKAAKDAADAAQGDVDALETLVGTIPGESEAATVIGYVNEQVAKASGDASKVAQDLADEIARATAAEGANTTAISNEVTRATGAEEALGGRIDDVEDLIGEVEEGKTVMGIVADNLAEAKGYTDTEIGKLGSVLNFKGTVATVAALPTEGMKVGDVYHVTEKSAEYVYTTDGWEELGSVLDLSAYETIEGAEGKIATAKSEAISAAEGYADGLDSAMNTRVEAIEQAIGEGGSVASQIQAAIEELDATPAQEASVNGLALSLTQVDGKVTAIAGSISTISEDDIVRECFPVVTTE